MTDHQIFVGIKSFSITRLKRGECRIQDVVSTSWNQKFLDYEIETNGLSACAGALRVLPLESKVSRLRD